MVAVIETWSFLILCILNPKQYLKNERTEKKPTKYQLSHGKVLIRSNQLRIHGQYIQNQKMQKKH